MSPKRATLPAHLILLQAHLHCIFGYIDIANIATFVLQSTMYCHDLQKVLKWLITNRKTQEDTHIQRMNVPHNL
jgi:hypothetical protein